MRYESCRFVWCTVLLVVCLMVAGISYGNGFRNPPGGAAALGRAGSIVTHIDDPSAANHNPANLAGITEPAGMLSMAFAHSRTTWTPVMGPSQRTDNDIAWLPHLHVAGPLAEDRAAWGVSLTTPFGQHTRWKQEGLIAAGAAPYFAEMMMLEFSPVAAYRVNERVTVGGGLNMYYSELEFRQVVPWGAMFGGPLDATGQARAKGDGVGLGGQAGLTLRLTDQQTLAATYRSPFNVDYDGSFRLTGVPEPMLTIIPARSDFDTSIRFPSIITVGYGVELTERIRVGVDVEWVEFSRYRELDVDTGDNVAFSDTIPQRWNDIWTVGVGGDWKPADSPWIFRAGYLFMESPVPTATMAPTLPDSDRHLLSIGFGYARDRHAVDVAYVYSWFRDRDVEDNQQPLFNGTYELSSQLVQLSYRLSL